LAAKKNPLSDKAYEMYKDGMKLVDIASQLEKPEGTIRRWKSTYDWDGERSEKKSERSVKSRKDNSKTIDDGTRETFQNDDLTPERQMFCVYYNRTFNATQSYQKAFGCKYETAMVEGCKLLRNPKIRAELDRLKEIKRQQIIAGTEDIVELQMRIAFADIGYYMQFGRVEVEVMGPFGPIKNPETGEVITREVNAVRLDESENVDTQIIQEVKQGRDGVSIKLADKQKAIEWLTNYFEANPQDRHKREFDKRKLELELLKLEFQTKEGEDDKHEKDNFLDALNESAKDAWSDG
jgi:phage terminase small subunit